MEILLLVSPYLWLGGWLMYTLDDTKWYTGAYWSFGLGHWWLQLVAQLVQNYNKIHNIILFANVLVVAIGLEGYQANVIQFGLDQLQDASTTEITAFICWYVWTVFGSIGVYLFISQSCLVQYRLLEEMLVCICITAAIGTLFVFNSKSMKEPTTQNPFKLIYKVIHYAIKHKHPLCRSAFYYLLWRRSSFSYWFW